jgi:hypothetical protein
MPRFSATIFKVGINPVVDPPERVLAAIFKTAGRSRGPIQVRGKLNGVEFVQTLIKYAGSWRLYINGAMLKESGTNVGDEVRIEIEFDPRPRDVRVPKSLAIALRNDVRAKAALERLPPSRRKEIFRYIGSLRTADAIEKNVEKVIRQLKGG